MLRDLTHLKNRRTSGSQRQVAVGATVAKDPVRRSLGGNTELQGSLRRDSVMLPGLSVSTNSVDGIVLVLCTPTAGTPE